MTTSKFAATSHGSYLERRNSLLQSIDELAPTLIEVIPQLEQAGRLPMDIATALASQGLYSILTPKSLGGLELDVHTFVLAIERLARYEASCGWCAFISNTSALLAGYLSPESACKVFNRPDLKFAGAFAPRGRALRTIRDGVSGYLVSGRWQWASGAANADYVVAGCMVLDDAGNADRLPSGSINVHSMLLDKAQVQILNNWTAMGLRGSGSGEFLVENAFVPADRSASIMSDTPLPLPLYKFPIFCLLALGVAAVALGVARLAIESLVTLSHEKSPQGSQRPLAERQSIQLQVARSEARLRAARQFLLSTVDVAWAAADDNRLVLDIRRDLRLATTYATKEAVTVVEAMYDCAGGDAVFASSPLQRCLRDVRVASQHVMVSESTYELTGRLFLDLPVKLELL